MLDRHENARMSINIQGCLIQLLLENDMQETVDLLRSAMMDGKVELVGSAMYHPILPLIPEVEVSRQISLNEEYMKKVFGNLWKKHGFFPPEMAVSEECCDYICRSGYEWVIMSGIANTGEWPINYVQQLGCGILSYFRDDYLSNEISFKAIDAAGMVHKLSTMYGNNQNNYVITAQDGETFGHHIKNYETSFLGKAFSILEDKKDVQVEFISNLSKIFPSHNSAVIRSSTWSTEWNDIQENVPYPLWKHPFNPLHKVQYRILQALYKLMEILDNAGITDQTDASVQEYARTARWFYDESLHSCWLWWASMRPHWSPNLIYKGIDLINKTALNAQLALINLKIGEGDEHYNTIIDNAHKLMIALIEQELSLHKVPTI
jgi:alpha-amylase/alpha-mannosidase (GH57 family)